MTDLEFFIRQTAKQVMIPENIVDTIIRDQWKHANKATSELLEVDIKDIGVFYPSPKKVATVMRKLIERHKRLLGQLGVYSEGRSEYKGEYKGLTEAEDHINRLMKTKHYGKSEKYMEKQGIDIRGYKEQYFSNSSSGGSSSIEDKDM